MNAAVHHAVVILFGRRGADDGEAWGDEASGFQARMGPQVRCSSGAGRSGMEWSGRARRSAGGREFAVQGTFPLQPLFDNSYAGTPRPGRAR